VGVEAARRERRDELSVPEQLSISLRITNLSTKPATYRSWSRPETLAVLRVQYGNYYNRIELPVQGEIAINPGETITDTLAFEAPPVNASLELDLPVSGTDKSFRFLIPALIVDRFARPASPARAQVVVPAQPEPLDPENDRQLRSRIIADYRAGVKEIERRALGMSFDGGQKYRRTGRQKLLEKLSNAHQLRIEQIRRIVGA
jgi:hypothetical protein